MIEKPSDIVVSGMSQEQRDAFYEGLCPYHDLGREFAECTCAAALQTGADR